ncbi:MAG: UDP-N-acetylmuramate dehydrogenase [Acidimicrobiia bacterium]
MIAHASVQLDTPLAPMTTYKVGGSARYFVEPDGLEELRSVVEATPDGMPIVVLGRGSNVVISDAGIDGLVIRLGRGFSGVDVRVDGTVIAGGGAALPVVARAASAEGRAGLEFYVGIPGSIGGAVRMNAGGHGSDTAEVLRYATIFSLANREVVRREVTSLGLSYRRSNLTDDDVVVQASFNTTPVDPEVSAQTLREITRWRKDNQPGGTLNAGSVFKNPEDQTAGELIDGLGLKGTSFGPVSVSNIHANFLVATKDADASDIFQFVHHLQTTVAAETGVHLEPEIRFLGSFDEDDAS